jgi:hypothetical protein
VIHDSILAPKGARKRVRPLGDATDKIVGGVSPFDPIVLQKSKVVELRIFAKNPNREAIADSYNLNRAAEVAYEFNARR